MTTYTFKSKIWLYPGMSGWFFVTVPKKQSEEIKKKFGKMARGWGSLPVVVTIFQSRSGRVGKTSPDALSKNNKEVGTPILHRSWKTSIFPDKKSGSYLLPLKSQVRKKENIREADTISLSLRLEP